MGLPSIDFPGSKSETKYIYGKDIGRATISKQRWETMSLAQQRGKTEFSIGTISKDICVTRSRCLFYQDYHACISYPEQTLLLVFGLKGYSCFQFEGQSQPHCVREGDIWLVQTENESLCRITPAGQENEMVVIKYAGQRLLDAFYDGPSDSSLLCNTKITRLGHQATSSFGIQELINNELDTASNRLIAESQALNLLAKWLAPYNSPNTDLTGLNAHKLPASEVNCMHQIIEILTSDLIRTPSLQQLAKRANMSHTKLNRCFKKVFGATVYEWLRNYRLERTRQYLTETKDNITDIAFQCGFSSASHFAHSFKQKYQCSPAEYRDNPSTAVLNM